MFLPRVIQLREYPNLTLFQTLLHGNKAPVGIAPAVLEGGAWSGPLARIAQTVMMQSGW